MPRWRATAFVVECWSHPRRFARLLLLHFVCAEVREKLVTRFHRTQEQADELVSQLILVSLLRDDVAEISSPLRDPDDNPILPAAVAYHCKFLVTGDDDLLELKSFSGVEIVSVRAFAERLQLKI